MQNNQRKCWRRSCQASLVYLEVLVEEDSRGHILQLPMINMCNADPARLSTTTLARFRQAVHSGGLGTITLARQQQTPRGQWTLHG